MDVKKILVVDDEVNILNMLRESFSRAGYTVFTAASAEEALKILKNESVLVMFLDLKLPSMSGIDLCKRIRKENQICIIHAFTGYSNIYGLLECRAAGFDDFFVKPVKTNLLLKAAQEAFDKLERWEVSNYDLA
ncbi:MAG TPA: response regulator [Syntrophales bacterium]|nr:response regulator [Syntrophales bacterium]